MSHPSPDELRSTIWQLLQAADPAGVRQAVELTQQLPPPADQPDELTAQCLFDAGFAIEFFGADDTALQLYRRVVMYPVADTKYIACAWFRIGVCTCRQGNLAEAIHCYRESLRLAPDLPHLTALACYYLAGLLEAAEEYAEAADLYGRLLPMLPHPDIHPQKARLGFARCIWRIGKAEIATAELNALLQDPADPISSEAWRLLAEIAEARRDYAAAERAYRRIIADPNAEASLRAAASYRLAAASAQARAGTKS